MKKIFTLTFVAALVALLAASPAMAQERGAPADSTVEPMVGCSGDDCWPTYSYRDVDTDIKALKFLLRERGFADYNADNASFGSLMLDSVRAFKSDEGLPANGIVNKPVWERVIVPLGPGDQGDAVRAVQIELSEQYNYNLPVTGNYYAQTRDAVEDFQGKRGLPQTGAVDAATWQALVSTR